MPTKDLAERIQKVFSALTHFGLAFHMIHSLHRRQWPLSAFTSSPCLRMSCIHAARHYLPRESLA